MRVRVMGEHEHEHERDREREGESDQLRATCLFTAAPADVCAPHRTRPAG